MTLMLLELLLIVTFEWMYKWKMQFNPDLNKQAQEVVEVSSSINSL